MTDDGFDPSDDDADAAGDPTAVEAGGRASRPPSGDEVADRGAGDGTASRPEAASALGSVHVESGGFRVDRSRALDKLMRFQLPDPDMFVLPLIRCAVAGGATHIRITTARAGFNTSRFVAMFDGRPFAAAELQDPYAILFEKRSPETARDRELASALLTALRSEPLALSVTSGAGRQRVRLNVKSVESDEVAPAPEQAGDTVFQLERRELIGQFEAALDLALGSCRVSRVPITVNRAPAQGAPEVDRELGLTFDEQGVRGWISVPEEIEEASSFKAFTYGVEAGMAAHRLPSVQVLGVVNDDRFALNASQTGVARNARFKATMEVVAGQAERLLLKVLESNGPRLERARSLIMDKDLAGVWRDRLDAGLAAENPGLLASLGKVFRRFSGVTDTDTEALFRAARAVLWLRDAAERNLKEYSKDIHRPMLRALWSHPMLMGSRGEILSLADIEALRSRMGFVPVSKILTPQSKVAFPIVWLSCDRDPRLLSALWKESFKDMTDAASGWEAGPGPSAQEPAAQVSAGRPGGEAGPAGVDFRVLSQAGFSDLLIRDQLTYGQTWIEVGIPAVVPERGAQVYLLEEVGPRRLDISPKPGFAAALASPAGVRPLTSDAEIAQAVAVATERAGALYRRLASEYDCWKHDQRNFAIRAALLDCLAAAKGAPSSQAQDVLRSPEGAAAKGAAACADRGNSAGLAERHRWLAKLPLFQTDSGWLDFDRLTSDFDGGQVICLLARSPEATGIAVRRCLVGGLYTETLMAALLPEAGFLDVEGFDGVRLMFKKSPVVVCDHKSDLGCLTALQVPAVHLTVGEGEGGRTLALPWGAVTAFGPAAALPGLEAALRDDAKTGLALVSAVIERFGTGWRSPGHPTRRFLLKAVGTLCSPWPGKAVPGSRLFDMLRLLPFFQSESPAGVSVAALGARLASGRAVTCQPRGGPPPAPPSADAGTCLALDRFELETIRRLWPDLAGRLAMEDAPEPPAGSAPATAPPEPVAAVVPGETAVPVGVSADDDLLGFGEPMLFERRYDGGGGAMKVRIGLAERFNEGLEIVIRRSAGETDLRLSPEGMPLVGAAVLDLSGSADPGLPAEESVVELFARFYLDLLACWPLAGPNEARHRDAARYLMRLLALNGCPEKRPGGLMGEALDKAWTLGMVPTLGLELASLDALSKAAVAQGFLAYASKAFFPFPAEDAGVPVLRKYEQFAVSSMISMGGALKLRPYRPPQAPAAPKPEEDPKESEPEIILILRRVLKHVRGRRGVKVLPGQVRWTEEPGQEMVRLGESGTVFVWKGHPCAKAVLESGLDPQRQALYLASLVFSATNRVLSNVTDQDDVRFHESLADLLAAPGAAVASFGDVGNADAGKDGAAASSQDQDPG
ncbi:MAG: hypothetical protein HY927_07225 [Elusimicrobia bacterium]|nr:hypothetical protein [Elusimicrobiota bacterium]